MKIKTMFIITLIAIIAMAVAYKGISYFKTSRAPKPVIETEAKEIVRGQAARIEAEKESSKMSVTYPNLSLEGTVIDKTPSAYIRDLDTKEAGFYHVGDLISEAKLLDIKRQEVTLEIKGERFTLVLAEESNSPIDKISDNIILVIKDRVLDIINSDPEKAKALAQIKPYIDKSGRFSGILIDGIKFGSLPYLAGLRNGDIIKKVNDQTLTTQNKALQTVKRVRRLKEIELVLLRNNRAMNLRYAIR